MQCGATLKSSTPANLKTSTVCSIITKTTTSNHASPKPILIAADQNRTLSIDKPNPGLQTINPDEIGCHAFDKRLIILCSFKPPVSSAPHRSALSKLNSSPHRMHLRCNKTAFE